MAASVLLLDPDPRFRAAVVPLLEAAGFDVRVTETVRQAAALQRHALFDAWVIDPGPGDAEALRWLTDLRRQGNVTPAILLSGNDLTLSNWQRHTELALVYVAKPVAGTSLAAQLHALLQPTESINTSPQHESVRTGSWRPPTQQIQTRSSKPRSIPPAPLVPSINSPSAIVVKSANQTPPPEALTKEKEESSPYLVVARPKPSTPSPITSPPSVKSQRTRASLEPERGTPEAPIILHLDAAITQPEVPIDDVFSRPTLFDTEPVRKLPTTTPPPKDSSTTSPEVVYEEVHDEDLLASIEAADPEILEEPPVEVEEWDDTGSDRATIPDMSGLLFAAPEGLKRLLLVETDPRFSERLAELGRQALVDIVTCRTMEEAYLAAHAVPFDAVFIDIPPNKLEEKLAGLNDLISLPKCAKAIRIAVSTEGALENRLAAAKAGVNVFLDKPVSGSVLFSLLRSVGQYVPPAVPTVLLLDPTGLYGTTLSTAAPDTFAIRTLSNPQTLVGALNLFRPEAIVLQHMTGDIATIDILSVLYGHPDWSTIPTIVLGVTEPTAVVSLYSAGAKLVMNHVTPNELSAILLTNIKADRVLRSRSHLNPPTGLLQRDACLESLASRFADTQRNSLPFTIAIIGIENLEKVRATHGNNIADDLCAGVARILATQFRAGDLKGHWSVSEFMVAFSRTAGGRRLRSGSPSGWACASVWPVPHDAGPQSGIRWRCPPTRARSSG